MTSDEQIAQAMGLSTVPPFSSDFSAAWTIVTFMRERGWDFFSLNRYPWFKDRSAEEVDEWQCSFQGWIDRDRDGSGKGATPAEAIVKAALKALQS